MAARAFIFLPKLTGEATYKRLAGELFWQRMSIGDVSYVPQIITQTDRLTLADAFSFVITPGYAEAISLMEQLELVHTKPLLEMVTPADVVALAVQLGEFADAKSITDSIVISAVKGVGETVGLNEIISQALSRPISDTQGIADSIAKLVARSPSETVAQAEVVSLLLTMLLADTVAVDDVLGFARPDARADNASATDAATRSIGKAVPEIVTISEAFAATIAIAITSRSSLAALPLGEWTLGD